MAAASATPAAMAAELPVPDCLQHLYPNPASNKHYTVMLLKNGRYLELKNPDRKAGKQKATFPTLDAWRIAHVGDSTTAVIRTTMLPPPKEELVVNPAHGYNVPPTDKGISRWFRWCYSMIAEAAPELFDSKMTAAAYNDLVAVCAKYPELELDKHIGMKYNGKKYNRYAENNLHGCFREADSLPHNDFPVYLRDTNKLSQYACLYICGIESTIDKYSSYYSHYIQCMAFLKKYLAIRSEIMPKCKALYDIIVPKLGPYMKNKRDIKSLEIRMKVADNCLRIAEEKKERLLSKQTMRVKHYETKIKNCQEEYTRLTGVVAAAVVVSTASAASVNN